MFCLTGVARIVVAGKSFRTSAAENQWTFGIFFLLCRPAISILEARYRFACEHDGEVADFGEAVLAEFVPDLDDADSAETASKMTVNPALWTAIQAAMISTTTLRSKTALLAWIQTAGSCNCRELAGISKVLLPLRPHVNSAGASIHIKCFRVACV